MLAEEPVTPTRARVREAVRVARKITRMLQGTMALEGQGLDRKTLREMTRLTAKEWLEAEREPEFGR